MTRTMLVLKEFRIPLTLLALVLGHGVLTAQGTGQKVTPQNYQQLKDQGQLPPSFQGFGQQAPTIITPMTAFSKAQAQGTLKGGGNTCDCWIAPDATYTTPNNNSDWNASGFNNGDDGSYGPIVLPFNFDLYGQTYNTVYININGNISFGNYYTAFSASGFPANGFVMVAPYWADVDLRAPIAGGNMVKFKVTPTAFFVNWINVGYYSMQTDKLCTFQLIVTDGNDPVIGIGKNVSFCYQDMQWTTGSASGGSMGFGGTPANVGANRGNGIDYIQFGRFDQPGTAYDGPFGANDGCDWLDFKNFVFTTAVSTSNIPPIGSGIFLCDTLETCVGQLNTLDMTFLSPEPLQTTTAISSCATLSNYAVSSNTPGNTCYITGQFTPLASEVGYHDVLFEATDNGTPPLTATYYIVVHVYGAPALAFGNTTTCDVSPPIALAPLMNPPLTTGGTWVNPNNAPNNGTMVPGVDPPGNYVYSVGGGGGCPSVGTVTVNVVQTPDAGLDGVLNTCNSNAPTDLFTMLGGTPDSSGYWTSPNGAPFVNPLYPGAAPPGIYTYTAVATPPCNNDQATVTVSIAQAPSAGQNAVSPLCASAPPLNMLGALGGTPDPAGNWYSPSGQIFSGTFNASVDLPGVYNYVTPAVFPCEPDSSMLIVTVDPLPYAGADSSIFLCADAPPEVLFNLLGPAPDPGGNWLTPSGALSNGILQPVLEVSGDYTYVAHGIGQCAALTDTAVVGVMIGHLPDVAFTAFPLAGCDPLDVTFANNTPVAQIASCDWTLGDGQTSSVTGNLAHTYLNPGTYSVSLTVTSPQGCVRTKNVAQMIHVDPAPEATFSVYPAPATVENSNVLLSSTDPNAVQWLWQIADLDTLTTRDVVFPFPDVLGDTYPVCLTVWDTYGCVDTVCKDVVIKDPLIVYAPNAFSPNGDGVNDFFYPFIIGQDASRYKLYVFDRWGSKVFESTDAHNVWAGSYMNSGTVLPTGVYVWRLITALEDGGGKREYTGHVSLLH